MNPLLLKHRWLVNVETSRASTGWKWLMAVCRFLTKLLSSRSVCKLSVWFNLKELVCKVWAGEDVSRAAEKLRWTLVQSVFLELLFLLKVVLWVRQQVCAGSEGVPNYQNDRKSASLLIWHQCRFHYVFMFVSKAGQVRNVPDSLKSLQKQIPQIIAKLLRSLNFYTLCCFML